MPSETSNPRLSSCIVFPFAFSRSPFLILSPPSNFLVSFSRVRGKTHGWFLLFLRGAGVCFSPAHFRPAKNGERSSVLRSLLACTRPISCSDWSAGITVTRNQFCSFLSSVHGPYVFTLCGRSLLWPCGYVIRSSSIIFAGDKRCLTGFLIDWDKIFFILWSLFLCPFFPAFRAAKGRWKTHPLLAAFPRKLRSFRLERKAKQREDTLQSCQQIWLLSPSGGGAFLSQSRPIKVQPLENVHGQSKDMDSRLQFRPVC